MIFLKLLGKLIKVLKSGESPSQLAWGFALGAILGFTPIKCLHNLVVVVLLIILNVNIAAALLAFVLYSFIAWIFDPFFHTIGFFILVKVPFLQSFWTILYNAPIAPLTRFNNTVVMGSLLFSFVMLVPNYFFFKWFVGRYRETWNEKIQKWKIIKILKGSKLVKFYFKIRKIGG